MALTGKELRGWLIRRLTGSLVVLSVVLVGAFWLLQQAPGDAADAWLVQNGGADAAQIARLRDVWNLDDPPVQRFFSYVGGLLRGDLGWSVAFERPVLSVMAERLPVTLALMGASITLAVLLGVGFGLIAGRRPGSITDRVISYVSLGLYALPGFWVALMLIAVFSVWLRWLPTGGLSSVASHKTGLSRLAYVARHLVLPVLTLGLLYSALYLRILRDGMAGTWPENFVRAGRARGLSERRLAYAHVARNALLPVLTMIGLQASSLIGGSIVVETVFAIPGFGRLAYEAMTRRDTPLLLGIVLASAIVVILVNMAIDLLYTRLDPRVRLGEREP